MLLERTIENISPVSDTLETGVRRALDNLTKPRGSLGRLEELALRVACIQGRNPPALGSKRLFVFAGDHGIAEDGVSAYPKAVTAQMTINFVRGGAAISVLARHFGVDVEIVDIGVDHEFPTLPGLHQLKIARGTANFAQGPAMTRKEAIASVEVGIQLAESAAHANAFVVGVGEMGIGNTTSAAAIASVLTGTPVREITGYGTGIGRTTWEKKVRLIEKGLTINSPDPEDPLDVLMKVGGLEIGAMTGVILGGAVRHVPVVLDGYISTAAALIACRLNPAASQVIFASHLSAEAGHRRMLDQISAVPLFDLQMRLGEGTGACIAMSLMEASVKILREMATFESGAVSGEIR